MLENGYNIRFLLFLFNVRMKLRTLKRRLQEDLLQKKIVIKQTTHHVQ